MKLRHGLTRRQYLAATGGAALAAGFGLSRPAAALESIRQGYQTNMWGMPTYYLLRSGALDKRGIRVEEFAVPSGNLTMQQTVAPHVELGTYAGASVVLAHQERGHHRRLSQGLAGCRARLQGGPQQGGQRHLWLLHVKGLSALTRDFQESACYGRREPRLSGRPQALHAGAGRNPAQGEEDLCRPRLEQGTAAGVHGAGARILMHRTFG